MAGKEANLTFGSESFEKNSQSMWGTLLLLQCSLKGDTSSPIPPQPPQAKAVTAAQAAPRGGENRQEISWGEPSSHRIIES